MNVEDANNLLDEALKLKHIMVARAIGEKTSDVLYRQTRSRLLSNPALRGRVPRVARTCESLGEFWGAIQEVSSQYQGRRDYLKREFEPLLSYLENLTLVASNPARQDQPGGSGVISPGVDSFSGPPTHQQTRIFIGYAWEDETMVFVTKLAEGLTASGFDVTYDQKSLKFGDYLPQFMESLSSHEFILPVLSPKYRRKANSRQGGVGYETHLISAVISQAKKSPRQIIPVLFKGSSSTSVPEFLSGKRYANFVENDYDLELGRLVAHIRDQAGIETSDSVSSAPSQSETTSMTLVATLVEVRPQDTGTEHSKAWLEAIVTLSFCNKLRLPMEGSYLRVAAFQPPGTGQLKLRPVNLNDWEILNRNDSEYTLKSKRAILPNESLPSLKLSLKLHKPFTDVALTVEGGASTLAVQELLRIELTKEDAAEAWDAQRRHHLETHCAYPREPMEVLLAKAFPDAEVSWSLRR